MTARAAWLTKSRRSTRLLRNLAHEVKNPLGGLRGAAQLLEAELPDPALTEYTRVIISEADRLQALVDRLAAPQRMPVQWQAVNIHEICERVCALVRAGSVKWRSCATMTPRCRSFAPIRRA